MSQKATLIEITPLSYEFLVWLCGTMTMYNKRKRKFGAFTQFCVWDDCLRFNLLALKDVYQHVVAHILSAIRSNEWPMNLKATFQHRRDYMEILISKIYSFLFARIFQSSKLIVFVCSLFLRFDELRTRAVC